MVRVPSGPQEAPEWGLFLCLIKKQRYKMEPDIFSPFVQTIEKRIRRINRILIALLYLTTLCSLVYFTSLLSFYFHARNILGRFPSYDNPDPKELSIYNQYNEVISRA